MEERALPDLAAAIGQFKPTSLACETSRKCARWDGGLAEAQDKAGVDVPVSEAYRALYERGRLVYELSGGTPQSLDHGTPSPQGAQTNE